MIASPDSTATTMKRALIYTISALDAAASLDMDRSNEDREIFAQQKRTLQAARDKVKYAEEALNTHIENECTRLQAFSLLGDIVLDRGVRETKSQMKITLNKIMPDGADMIFGVNVTDLVLAEMRNEPALVFKALDRFDETPDFPGKQELRNNLAQRAEQQNNNLEARDEAERVRAKLANALAQRIKEGSDLLYALEKALLGRFLRDKVYVQRFFIERPASKAEKIKAKKIAPTT